MNQTVRAGAHICMTTRHGGVSNAPYESLNLGDHVGDVPDSVAANRKILEKQMGARPVFMRQVHGTRCLQIDVQTPDGLEADAVVTTVRGLACVMLVADCLPVLLWNASATAVGAVHAGWRGLVGGVLASAVQAMRELSKPDEPIHAWLGPCIGPDHFEVGAEVAAYFLPTHKKRIQTSLMAKESKYLVDLAAAARHQLEILTIKDITGHDGLPDWCTHANEAQYFSHRRDAKRLGNTGRMAACIWMD